MSQVFEINIDQLDAKMILVEDIHSNDGKLLLRSGYELSKDMILLIKNFKELKGKKLKIIKTENASI